MLFLYLIERIFDGTYSMLEVNRSLLQSRLLGTMFCFPVISNWIQYRLEPRYCAFSCIHSHLITMKNAILDVLATKGPLAEKKLRKYALKSVESAVADEVAQKAEFESALKSLLKKSKVALVDDIYSLTVTDSKRKRSDSEVAEPAVVAVDSKADSKIKSDVEQGEQVSKKAKKEKKSEPAASAWAGKYEELWKNGEKHWRDGTFDAEYLRTNPDK